MSRHYENFTVGSLLFPRRMRQDLANFYAFCRYSDDLGDEGDTLSEAGRTEAKRKLDAWDDELSGCYDSQPNHPVFVALQHTIVRCKLPPKPFRDLISAFRQDQDIGRYETFDDLLDYCSRSANPVGRIFLLLFGLGDDKLFTLADKICTALQLTNFWQDIAVDLAKGRIYLPLMDLKEHGYTEEELIYQKYNENFRRLLKFEVERTRNMFHQGAELEGLVPKGVRLEIRLFRKGGEKILSKIEAMNYNVFKRKPVLNKFDKVMIFLSSLISLRLGVGR